MDPRGAWNHGLAGKLWLLLYNCTDPKGASNDGPEGNFAKSRLVCRASLAHEVDDAIPTSTTFLGARRAKKFIHGPQNKVWCGFKGDRLSAFNDMQNYVAGQEIAVCMFDSPRMDRLTGDVLFCLV